MFNKIYNKRIFTKYEYLKVHLLAITILFLTNVVVNGSMEIKGFFMDDLSYWSAYHNMTSVDFIFNTVANKFRPVANIFMLIGFKLMGYDTGFSDACLLFFNFIAAVTVYIVVYKITKEVLLSGLAGVLYIFSNFAYYQIIQFFGIMESTGLILSTISLYLMYRFINGDKKYFWYSSLSIACAVFSHERYMVLYLVLLAAVFLYKDFALNKKRTALYIISSLLFLVVIATSRFIIIGNGAFAGTGGTSIAGSFDLGRVIKFIFWCCLNMFGINAGEPYLNGITFGSASFFIKFLAIIFASRVITIITKAFLFSIKYKKWQDLKNIGLFIFFIGGCIVSSCATIRLEMRWLYTPFVGMIILFCYCLKVNSCYNNKKHSYNTYIIAIVVLCTFIPIEIYYRAHYDVIYCFPSQKLYNQFFEDVYEKYNGAMYERPLVFLEKTKIYYYEDTFKLWLKEYKKDTNLKDAEIYYYNHASEVPSEIMNKEPIIVLIDSSNTILPKIFDVTDEINDFYSKNNLGTNMRSAVFIDGFYGWEGNKDFSIIGKKASLYIKSGSTGKVKIVGSTFNFNNPNKMTLRFEGIEVGSTVLNNEDVDVEIQTSIPVNTKGTLEIELENAKVPYELGLAEDRRAVGMIINDIILD